jgi:hypothetical protein
MILVQGDRVRLTDHAIRAKLSRRHYYRDWERRQGTVVSVTPRRVRVVWDGRTSCEIYVPKAVERVQEQP